uniref:Uncharacterized protein n=1 Tax=Caloglossa intermedia TaxID=100879 RepID=A0A1Z1M691_9FLOR|nr:hypothetical protein [Caloglossa intermedia]ARW61361.1 hypothetical protein [Caloglossa intermedia]
MIKILAFFAQVKYLFTLIIYCNISLITNIFITIFLIYVIKHYKDFT